MRMRSQHLIGKTCYEAVVHNKLKNCIRLHDRAQDQQVLQPPLSAVHINVAIATHRDLIQSRPIWVQMRLSFPIPLHVFTHVFSRQPGIGYFQPSKTPFSHQSSCPKPSSAPWQVSPQNPNRTRPFDSQIAWRGTARPRRTRGFRRILLTPISIHAL